MIASRYRLLAATTTLFLLFLWAYRNVQATTEQPITSIGAKIAGAKERLQENLEEQNRQLKHALASAKASLQKIGDAAKATPLATPLGSVQKETLDGKGFAYVFYATENNYACSALVNIYRLTKILHTKIAIHVLATQRVSEEYISAMKAAGAVVHIRSPPPMPENAVPYYQDCLLKLRAFQMHKLSPGLTRVLAFDADQLIMKNLDHLFFDLPVVDLAAPRAYWLNPYWISSTFVLITPSDRLWDTIDTAIQQNLNAVDHVRYDMDIVNDVLGDTVMLLGGEYVCINSHWEDWNLPRWHHAEHTLNWTTIKTINDLAKPEDVGDGGGSSSKAKRQTFTHTDLPVQLAPTPLVDPQQQPHTLADDVAPEASPQIPDEQPQEAATPSPRFPLQHPLSLELERLHFNAPVIHFFAVGKPWTFDHEMVTRSRLDAHPLLAAQFRVWRDVADEVCPVVAAPDEPEVPGSLTMRVVSASPALSTDVRSLSGVGVPMSTT